MNLKEIIKKKHKKVHKGVISVKKIKEPILLFDFNYIAIRTSMAMYSAQDKKELVQAKGGLIKKSIYASIFLVCDIFKTAKLKILCQDHCKNWRKDYDPEYKLSRKDFKEEKNIDWKALYALINEIKENLVKHFQFIPLCVEKCEADDCIGALSKFFSQRGNNVVIVSGDIDMMQLTDFKNVYQFDPFQKKIKEWKYSWCKNGDMFINVFSICGQKKDEIRQVRPRIGEKTALNHVLGVKKINFNEDELERIKLNKKLLNLKKLPTRIEESILLSFKEKYNEHKNNELITIEELLDWFEEQDFNQSLLQQLGWIK